jgi:hypothetical protein
LHHARYGFAAINPFRPRILSAGTWFLFFCLLPAYAAITEPAGQQHLFKTASKPEKIAIFLVFYYAGCAGVAYVLIGVFDVLGSSRLDPLIIVISAVAAVVVGSLYKFVQCSVLTTTVALLSVVGSVTLAILNIIRHKGFAIDAVALWFFFVGLAAVIARALLSSLISEFRVHWVTPLSGFLIALTLFGVVFYPHMKSDWGGGKPTAVTLYFTPNSPILPNKHLQTQLIEETDAGYFVVSAEQKAIFVPRGSVSLAYFSDKPLDSSMMK